MENNANLLANKESLLKVSRFELLRLHKLLVDIERAEYEKDNGQISSGQFLNLLLGEESFQWLRKFSTLIVEIDEMLDLDDGYSIEMIKNHLSAMKEIVELKTADETFNDKYRGFLQAHTEISQKNEEIKDMLSNE